MFSLFFYLNFFLNLSKVLFFLLLMRSLLINFRFINIFIKQFVEVQYDKIWRFFFFFFYEFVRNYYFIIIDVYKENPPKNKQKIRQKHTLRNEIQSIREITTDDSFFKMKISLYFIIFFSFFPCDLILSLSFWRKKMLTRNNSCTMFQIRNIGEWW